MCYEKNFGFIVSSIIIIYGCIIYLLLFLVNIKVENILIISITTSCCIITYELTYQFCNNLYVIHLKIKEKNKILYNY